MPAAASKVFSVAHSTEEDFINHYNEIRTSKSVLPEWALKQIFCFLRTNKPDGVLHDEHNKFLREFFVTHRGAAMDCFFDNIVHQDTSSGQYLIYTP